MTYIITENCIKCKYTDCVEVCPVDCFHEGPNFLVINPEECIDCSLCEPECPINAIISDEDVTDDNRHFLEINERLSKKWPIFSKIVMVSAFSLGCCPSSVRWSNNSSTLVMLKFPATTKFLVFQLFCLKNG